VLWAAGGQAYQRLATSLFLLMRSCQNLSISSLLCMFSAILWRRNSMKNDILRAGKWGPRWLAGNAQKPAPCQMAWEWLDVDTVSSSSLSNTKRGGWNSCKSGQGLLDA